MRKISALLALVLALFALPACKKEDNASASFSQGGKSKKRSLDKIDRSKEVPVATTNAPANAVTKGSFTVWTEPKDPTPGESYQVFIEVRLPSSVSNYTQKDLSGNVTGTDGYQQGFGTSAGGCGDFEESFDDKGGGEYFPEGQGPNGVGGGATANGKNVDPTLPSDEGFGLKAKHKGLHLQDCDGSGYEKFFTAQGRARLSITVPGAATLVRDTIEVSSKVLNERQTIAIEF